MDIAETEGHVQDQEAETDRHDLLRQLAGFCRLLDLVSEQGSGGLGMPSSFALEAGSDSANLVDKVIIDQESTGQLINTLKRGAYRSLTRVDFAAMDDISVSVLGVYGSKTELVRFFKSLDVVTSDQ